MSTFGVLAELPSPWVGLGLTALFLGLAFVGARLWLWSTATLAALWFCGASLWLWLPILPVLLILNAPPLRQSLISARLLRLIRARNLLPAISDTERIAIEAGNVWVDKELFSGKPDLRRLSREPYPELTERERAFLAGPVEEVCRMTRDWEVSQRRDLPTEVWDYLKAQRFFGMIIPEQYGGLGFSALAHGAVVQKLSSRSMPLAITVMVPNSLGPAELLLHFGTEAQRKHYLPRLAVGAEVPCFALTEPGAGSDAGSMTSHGVLFENERGELCIRLNWEKRYITLAAVSTVLGLAFQLHDPDQLLGRGRNLGITCALIPTGTEGVELGMRHDPLGIPFYNCPTRGVDVVVPVDAIIGGIEGAGHGWKMLMECLAAGRGISLPGTSTGGAKLVARVAGAYAAVRKQFGLSIGRFEGIEEPLARIGGVTWLLEAARRYTCGALDAGNKPPVVTAIAKLSFTELYRGVINDGMDILGGAAISRGPRNLLGNAYIGTPISITVEGANILTRTMIIFGQGAIRCHAFAFEEIEAAAKDDLPRFDAALFGHLGQVVRNQVRAALLSVSRGLLALPPIRGATARYYRKLAWASASFATMADLAMGAFGGDLKRKEKLTGRFADVFSWMYLAAAGLRRFEADGRRAEDLPFLHWSMQLAFQRIHEAMQGLYRNFDVPVLGALLRGPVALWGRLNPIGSPPSDRLGSKVARTLQTAGAVRDRLTDGIFVPQGEEEHLATLENALLLHWQADAVAQKLKAAVRGQRIPKGPPEVTLAKAVEAGVLSHEECELLRTAERARTDAITVDSFSLEDYFASAVEPESAPEDRAVTSSTP
ncbi:MAG: acyl-CoA dehydrogenase [Planctomycetes bacterium]|nr:acyl-CoA dehydrogenase [Planctomycetota bacterium]